MTSARPPYSGGAVDGATLRAIARVTRTARRRRRRCQRAARGRGARAWFFGAAPVLVFRRHPSDICAAR
ncbi:hypothetical protein V5799_032139 [Amblyomma americanum]|uniref:Uncharacterized protein n=1 Tax=Amblyomma americanum TaxID=6943 RepID=A0AAQ4DS15_AMBAM